MTPAGFELATFRFVAQHFNYCATAVPSFLYNPHKYFQHFHSRAVSTLYTDQNYKDSSQGNTGDGKPLCIHSTQRSDTVPLVVMQVEKGWS